MHTLIVEQEIVEDLPAEVVNSSIYMDQVGQMFQKKQPDADSQLVKLVQLSVADKPTDDEVRKSCTQMFS